MNMYEPDDDCSTLTLRNPIASRRLRRLRRKLDDCCSSDEYIAVIRAIARTGEPQAIEVLAALLDSPGPVGQAAMRGLRRFGLAAVPEMERVIRESLDPDACAHARDVLRQVRARAPGRAA